MPCRKPSHRQEMERVASALGSPQHPEPIGMVPPSSESLASAQRSTRIGQCDVAYSPDWTSSSFQTLALDHGSARSFDEEQVKTYGVGFPLHAPENEIRRGSRGLLDRNCARLLEVSGALAKKTLPQRTQRKSSEETHGDAAPAFASKRAKEISPHFSVDFLCVLFGKFFCKRLRCG